MSTIFSVIGGASVNAGASGGKVTPVNNVGTGVAQVVAQNAQRQTLTFANPGTVTVYVGPTKDANGNTITPTLAALGGTFPVFAGGLLVIAGECQQAWQALAASGASNPLTVMESNL
jgi:hypothetical protein